MAILVVYDVDGEPHALVLAGDMRIGRWPGHSVALTWSSIGKDHAGLVPRADRWVLVDHRSVNGTFVNGKKIDEHLLRSRDVIRVGSIKMEFFDDSDAPNLPLVHGRLLLDYRFTARTIVAKAKALEPGSLVRIDGRWVWEDEHMHWEFALDAVYADGRRVLLSRQGWGRDVILREAGAELAAHFGVQFQVDEERRN